MVAEEMFKDIGGRSDTTTINMRTGCHISREQWRCSTHIGMMIDNANIEFANIHRELVERAQDRRRSHDWVDNSHDLRDRRNLSGAE